MPKFFESEKNQQKNALNYRFFGRYFKMMSKIIGEGTIEGNSEITIEISVIFIAWFSGKNYVPIFYFSNKKNFLYIV